MRSRCSASVKCAASSAVASVAGCFAALITPMVAGVPKEKGRIGVRPRALESETTWSNKGSSVLAPRESIQRPVAHGHHVGLQCAVVVDRHAGVSVRLYGLA